MGTIKIFFVGICTHMRFPESELPGYQRRVVLVNGRIPRVINETPIPSHNPTLRVSARDLVLNGASAKAQADHVIEWDLMGAHLSVANGIGELTYDDTFECCIPHLKKLTHDLPGPSAEVVLGADPQRASCYFDITHGTFSAGYIANGASTAVLNMTTKDDEPVLQIRKFHETTIEELHLRSGAEIAFMNVGTETGDDDNDFLLHYETAEYVPANAAVPTSIAPCCQKLPPTNVIPGGLSVGPGCSNSDFP
jgi:hypothetical protein